MIPLHRILLWLLVACSFAGLLSPLYWFFDLFNHFRAHALLASIGFFATALAFDKASLKLAATVLSANTVLCLMPIVSTSGLETWNSPHDSRDGVKIVSSNVYTANTNYQRAIEVTTKADPDIIAFTEMDARWIENVASLKKTYPHTLKHPRSDNFGIAVYSKLPFKPEIYPIGKLELPLAVLEFEHFTLIVAHPIPPTTKENLAENITYMHAIAERSSKSGKPVVLAGDLNTTIWGGAIQPLVGAGLKRVNRLGFAFTWPVQIPFLALQIDHFFARNVASADFKVREDIGSDHFPIEASFNFPNAN